MMRSGIGYQIDLDPVPVGTRLNRQTGRGFYQGREADSVLSCEPEGKQNESGAVGMSIEQTDVIDIISTDRVSGHVVLTISDHLD